VRPKDGPDHRAQANERAIQRRTDLAEAIGRVYIEHMKNPTIDTRLHFSPKEFRQRGWDKHLIGGAMMGIGGAGAVLLFTQNPTPESMAIAAAWTGVVTGAAVELMDYRNNKLNHPKPPHGVELMDFLFTALGGAISALILYLLLK